MIDKNSYNETIELIKIKISECSDFKSKLNFIEMYLTLIKNSDIIVDEDLIDLTEDILSIDINIYMMSNKLPMDIILKYTHLLDLSIVSFTQDLTREFIIDNKEHINFSKLSLSNYMLLNNDDFTELSDNIDWDIISLIDNLPIEFIRMNKDKLNWVYISSNIELSMDEMEEFSSYIDWKIITICQMYDDEFKNKHNLSKYLDDNKRESDDIIKNHNSRYKLSSSDREEYYKNLSELIKK